MLKYYVYNQYLKEMKKKIVIYIVQKLTPKKRDILNTFGILTEFFRREMQFSWENTKLHILYNIYY